MASRDVVSQAWSRLVDPRPPLGMSAIVVIEDIFDIV